MPIDFFEFEFDRLVRLLPRFDPSFPIRKDLHDRPDCEFSQNKKEYRKIDYLCDKHLPIDPEIMDQF